jgi:predicted phage terminase large subunit-like protein
VSASLADLPDGDRLRLRRAYTPRLTPYLSDLLASDVIRRQTKQWTGLLLSDIRELLFGGAAGGGKSAWLLMAALQYVDAPKYNAILIRRTFKQLAGAEGLVELAHEWLDESDARWYPGEWKWVFPAGAQLWFGHLGDANAHTNYQGLAYDFIGFDELTQFTEQQYKYVAFSRGRRRSNSTVPLRIRATSNPGGIGHEWVRSRFGIYVPDGDEDTRRLCERPEWVRAQNDGRGRVFLPSRVVDNPSLDIDEYVRDMGELDPTTREQLLNGDWDARPPGELFRREWFDIVDAAPDGCRWARHWDLAATEVSQENPDPDWTAGLRLGQGPDGDYYVEDLWHDRQRPRAIEAAMQECAERDGLETTVLVEQEPGASGKAYVDHVQRTVLPAHEVRALSPGTDKVSRARPVSAKAEARMVKVVRGPWNERFFDEVDAFTTTGDHPHDDIVDALSGAFGFLAGPDDSYFEDLAVNALADLGSELETWLADFPETLADVGPVDGVVHLGIRWGETTHALLGWQLRDGGWHVAREFVIVGGEPADHAEAILALNGWELPWGRAFFDVSGVPSQKAFNAVAGALLGSERPSAKAIPFGTIAPTSGRSARRSYKGIVCTYLRRLSRRSAGGETAQVLSVSPQCPVLLRQLRQVKRDPEDPNGAWKKGTDQQGPEALAALVMTTALRHRTETHPQEETPQP